MIYRHFELHNVAEVEQSPSGLRMYRYPKALCDNMGWEKERYGRYVSQHTVGCEIRFVTEGDRARITLTSLDQDGYVEIFRGDFRYYVGYSYIIPIKKGVANTIELVKSPNFEKLDPSLKRKPGGFSPDVWRIMSDINITMALVDFEGFGYEVRPPRPDELPRKTLLCYGTSLSYGACASAHCISYTQLLGRLLNVNLLNKSMGGSCMNERIVADYFASDEVRFDAILLENSVNMGPHAQGYQQNSTYLLDQLTAKKPHVPIYMVTSYPNHDSSAPGCACPVAKKDDASQFIVTDRIIRGFGEKYPQVRVLEGAEMMNDFTGLTCDVVHMSDYGQIMTATNLARELTGDWLTEVR